MRTGQWLALGTFHTATAMWQENVGAQWANVVDVAELKNAHGLQKRFIIIAMRIQSTPS